MRISRVCLSAGCSSAAVALRGGEGSQKQEAQVMVRARTHPGPEVVHERLQVDIEHPDGRQHNGNKARLQEWANLERPHIKHLQIVIVL